MADVVFVGIIVVFFAVAWLLVRLCERIVGAENLVLPESEAAAEAMAA